MSLDNLPAEWSYTSFENIIFESTTGLVRSASEQSNDKQFAYLKMNNLTVDGKFNLLDLQNVDATDSEVEKNQLLVNDFLFNTRNSPELVGKCGVWNKETDFPILFNNNLLRVRFRHTNPYIVSYWLNSAYGKKQLRELVSATTSVAAIYQKQLFQIKVPIPPLAEQQEIVRQLDLMLAQVEQIKARLDSIPTILKKFRQSVLADAVSGDLLKDTSLIFDKLALSQLTAKIGSGSTPKGGNSAYQEVGIPLVRSLNIHTNYIKYKDLAFINQEQANKLKNVEIFKDDVLLNITGASIGRVNITPKEFIGGRVNQHVAIIRCDQTRLLPQYLHIYLASPNLQKWIEGENYGATRQALTKGMLDSLVIEFPSIEDQIKIISKVNELFNFSNDVEHTVQATQKRVNLLTQSILAKAFSGELTAEWREQHQELITGVNSAEALLAKIQAEREASKPVKKTRKKLDA